MFEVAGIDDGVVRFAMARRLLGKDLYRAACYWVDGLLIDSGISHRRMDLATSLSGYPVSAIVNTHAHEDHMGANALLQSARRVPVFGHTKALPTIEDPRKLSLLPYQRLFFGEPSPAIGTPVDETIATRCHTFRVLHAPGHSPDHIVLHEADRGWLFAGDAFIAGQDRVFRGCYDIREMTATLRMLASLGAEIMFTGMGNVVRRPAKQIERKLDHFEEISQRIGMLRREGLKAAEIARRLFPRDLAVRLVTSGDFSAEHLVRSVLRGAES